MAKPGETPHFGRNSRSAPDPREVDVWLFDLDNTLYPASCNLFDQIDQRMGEFIGSFLSIALDEARKLQKRYFRDHGTTMRGLMLNHAVKPADYLAFVHEIDLSVLPPNPALDTSLAALPGRKLVFTNASRAHAERVLERVGITHHFEDVFDIADAGYMPKPHAEAYYGLLRRHVVAPEKAVLFEDSQHNLAPAAALGMTTVWVTSEVGENAAADRPDFIHHVTSDLAAWLQELNKA